MFNFFTRMFDVPSFPYEEHNHSNGSAEVKPHHKTKSLKARYLARDIKTAITHIKKSQKVGLTREQKKHHIHTATGVLASVHKRLQILDWD